MGKYRSWQNASRRSGFEDRVEDTLKHLNAKYEYEPDILKYELPATTHNYHPDFKLRDNVYIEAKGEFTAADRKKMLAVQEQYPDVKIYILFQKAGNTLSKKSKTTYRDWCSKNGFESADFSEKEIWTKWL